MKQRIYNLIILDESGSMGSITQQTINGCNETLNTIQTAAEQFAATQEHFVSIYAFQGGSKVPSRYLLKNAPAGDLRHIGPADYQPWGNTPLNDAVGGTLADLKAVAAAEPGAIGSVTIITDGEENTSEHYTTEQVAKMIKALKKKGWNFNFIGANIDVVETSRRYHIDNCLAFEQDEAGTREMFERERKGKMGYLGRVHAARMACPEMTQEDAICANARASAGYYGQADEEAGSEGAPECSPEVIDRLEPGQVFVFGSNLAGDHAGGAARAARLKFGAVQGQGEGLQGQSYAIPTMQGGVDTIAPYVDRFVDFARRRPDLTFLVTRVGCGIAGFTDTQIAPLFREALRLPNVRLPRPFVDILL